MRTMSKTSGRNVRNSFRPLLEVLEDRTVLSAGGWRPNVVVPISSQIYHQSEDSLIPLSSSYQVLPDGTTVNVSVTRRIDTDFRQEITGVIASAVDVAGIGSIGTGNITHYTQNNNNDVITDIVINRLGGAGTEVYRDVYTHGNFDGRGESFSLTNWGSAINTDTYHYTAKGFYQRITSWDGQGNSLTHYTTSERVVVDGGHSYSRAIGTAVTFYDTLNGRKESAHYVSGTMRNFADGSWNQHSFESNEGNFFTLATQGSSDSSGTTFNRTYTTNDFLVTYNGQSDYNPLHVGTSVSQTHNISHVNVYTTTLLLTPLGYCSQVTTTQEQILQDGTYDWSTVNRPTQSDYVSGSYVRVISSLQVQVLNQDPLGNIVSGSGSSEFSGILVTVDSGSWVPTGGPTINPYHSSQVIVLYDNRSAQATPVVGNSLDLILRTLYDTLDQMQYPQGRLYIDFYYSGLNDGRG